MKRVAKAYVVGLLSVACSFFADWSVFGDDIYVGNIRGNNVSKIDSSGNGSIFAPILIDSNSPEGLAFDSSGNLYVAYNSGAASKIERYDPSGNGTLFAYWRSGVEVDFPIGLAFDGSGNLYSADFRDNLIQKFDSSGHSSVFARSLLYTPYGLAFDGNGYLYVANLYSNTIVRFDSSGHGSVFADASSGLDGPVGLAFDGNGNLYVSNTASTIEKFDSSGHGSLFATASSGLLNPQGLAFDSSGNLYVANYGYNNVEKFDSDGNGSVFADGSSGLNGPGFIAVQVPEPRTGILVALGAIALLGCRRLARGSPQSRLGCNRFLST